MRAICIPVGLLLGVLFAAPAASQSPSCAAYAGPTGRACQAAVDGTRAFHPIYGLIVSGGNPVLGDGSPLGGLGHVSVTARANGARVVLPALDYDGSTGTVPTGDKTFVPAPVVEVAAGVYGGSGTGLLAIDVLGSAQLLPTSQLDNLTIQKGTNRVGSVALGFGYGLRVGILRELGPLPGVSVSVMRRDVPRITYGDIAGGGDYEYDTDLHATNLRVVASKQLLVFGVAAGLGWDRYTGNAGFRFRDPDTGLAQARVPLDLKTSRTMAFLDTGFNLSVVHLVGEIGYQFGRDQKLTTSFEDFDTTKGRFFGGLGLRFAL